MHIETVGIHSPGAMGHEVGRVLAGHGLRVIAALEGRSEGTRERAARAGIADVGTLARVAGEADVILSILVPAAAYDAAVTAALAIQGAGTRPLYADCNAVAAATSRRAGRVIERAGGRYVDASIIGPPPRRPGTTRFYASGALAGDLAALERFGLDVRVVGEAVGQASQLKTCYASLTKGLQALAAELLVAARREGLDGPLREEFGLSQPGLLEWMERTVPAMPPKAHRWVGEMAEHGHAYADMSLPPDLMRGAAAMYRLVADTPPGRGAGPAGPEADLDAVIAAIADALPRE